MHKRSLISFTMQFKITHLLIALVLFVIEILVATTFSQVVFVRSFLGDYLVVMLLYHLVKAFRAISPLPLAVAVFIFSCLVEISQYFHLADALGAPRGGLVSILLGTNFSWTDIVMYLLGCITSYLLDTLLLSKIRQVPVS